MEVKSKNEMAIPKETSISKIFFKCRYMELITFCFINNK